MKFLNLIGQKFEKLTVISRVLNTKKWLCKCDCGNEVIVFSSNLRRGNTRSCGCIRALPDNLAVKRSLFSNYKRTCAAKRKISFALTFEEFINLIQQNCYYCGTPPKQHYKLSTNRKGLYYNGLDRLINSKGYEIDNVVPCCKVCNRAKWEKDEAEFVDWINRCHNHLKSQGLI